MPRALTILKYLPAVLCGLLVVAWVVSVFVYPSVQFSLPNGQRMLVSLEHGSIVNWDASRLVNSTPLPKWRVVFGYFHRSSGYPWQWLGKLNLTSGAHLVPLTFPLTLLLPPAIGPFIRFRFPLWSWFAFTALVAMELAYYASK